MKTGKGLDNVQFYTQVDHPDYRHLFDVLRASGGPIPVAIDQPYSLHSDNISRDEWMAQTILSVFKENQSAKMLVIVGNLHTLTQLEWEDHVPNKRKSIREYISKDQPSLKMWSVGLAHPWKS